tara:strand:- start:198 stop:374 length:177 start_codon:yes stop_codon:yes gene_type:complete
MMLFSDQLGWSRVINLTPPHAPTNRGRHSVGGATDSILNLGPHTLMWVLDQVLLLDKA